MARVARRQGTEIEYFGFDLFDALDYAGLLREFSISAPSRQESRRIFDGRGSLGRSCSPAILAKTLLRPRDLGAMDLIFIDGGHSQEPS